MLYEGSYQQDSILKNEKEKKLSLQQQQQTLVDEMRVPFNCVCFHGIKIDFLSII